MLDRFLQSIGFCFFIRGKTLGSRALRSSGVKFGILSIYKLAVIILMLTMVFNPINALVISAASNTSAGSVLSTYHQPQSRPPAAPDGFIWAAHVGNVSLYYREADFSVAVRVYCANGAGGLWLSYLPMEEYIGPPLNDVLLAELGSLFLIDYVDLGGDADRVTSANVLELNPTVTTTMLPSGFRYNFLFAQLNLRLSMDFELEEGRLIVSVPQDKIIEDYGAAEQIARHIPTLTAFGEFMTEIADEIDSFNLPTAYTGHLRPLRDEITRFNTIIAQIAEPATVGQAADNLLISIRRMRELTSSGEPTALGILNHVRTSEEQPQDVVQRFNRLFFELNDHYDLAEMAVSILRSVRVTGIVELHLLPHFGSAGNGSTGYMVYPDGSGARTFFGEHQNRFAGAYRMDIYGSTPDFSDMTRVTLAGQQPVMLPVIGVVKEGAGFAAAITSGDSEGIITFRPSGYVFDVNRVFFGFRYRREVAAPAQMGVFTGGHAMRLEDQRADIHAEITYIFLPPGQVSYSGMANALRELFIENGTLVPSPLASQPFIALEMAGGFNNRQLIFDNYITLTSYNQGAAIIRDLSENQPIPLLVNYTAWNDGRNTTRARPVRAFGGSRDFRYLQETALNAGGRLFIEVSPFVTIRGRDNAPDRDLAIATDNLVFGSDTHIGLLAPSSVLSRVNRHVDDLANYGTTGMTVGRAGSLIYYDYNATRPVTRQETMGFWQEALVAARQGLGYAAARGGNAYVLGQSDWLIDIPHSATGFVFTHESIPLFQMIVHGAIPFTGKPVNLFHNPPMELLRMIEFGYTPIFAMVYGEPDFRVGGFYTRYENSREMIISLAREYAASFEPIIGRTMIEHERTTGPDGQILARVEYTGGYRLLINYGSQIAQFEGFEIPALGYAVIDPTGNIFSRGDFTYEATEIPEFETARESGGLSVFTALVLGLCGILLLSAILFFAARLRKGTR